MTETGKWLLLAAVPVLIVIAFPKFVPQTIGVLYSYLNARLEFLHWTAVISTIVYWVSGALLLFLWQLVFRRSRKLQWPGYLLAISIAAASSVSVMMALVLNADYPNESSGLSALGIMLISFAAGGIVGAFMLVVAWWWLGIRITATSRPAAIAAQTQGRPSIYLRVFLFVAVLPGVLLSLTLDGQLGEIAPYFVFGMCILGVIGLRESLFCSHRDSEQDRSYTRRLLVIGLAGAAITLATLVWILVAGDRYMHRSGRHADWLIYLIPAAAAILIQTRELRRITRRPSREFEIEEQEERPQ